MQQPSPSKKLPRTTDAKRSSSHQQRQETLTLQSVVLLQPLLFGELLSFLPARSIAALCRAFQVCRTAREVLADEAQWTRFMTQHCPVDWSADKNLGALNPHETSLGCRTLEDYVGLRWQLEDFGGLVEVVKGDIGTITHVGDAAIDCLVFPTSHSFMNPHVGVAARVHERAGPSLDREVVHLRFSDYVTPGSVMATAGYDSGMRLLVHCAGPYATRTTEADRTLYKTYVEALTAVHNSNVTCAAVASISTGLMGFPYDRAAPIALAAVRDMMRAKRNWRTKVAFVCFEDEGFTQFEQTKRDIMLRLHSDVFDYPDVLAYNADDDDNN